MESVILTNPAIIIDFIISLALCLFAIFKKIAYFDNVDFGGYICVNSDICPA